jgi:hypothetical protein
MTEALLMRTPFKFLALLAAFSAMGLGASFAGEKVWVGLYLATNEPPAPDAHLAPEKLHHGLKEVFGFRHYELMKEQDIALHNEWEQWFMPRKDFFLRLEPLHHEPGEPKIIAYEIYKDGFIVAKGRYEPQDDTPLFIGGPFFHKGQLIFVLDAR